MHSEAEANNKQGQGISIRWGTQTITLQLKDLENKELWITLNFQKGARPK
jgi:hypothetical protein